MGCYDMNYTVINAIERQWRTARGETLSSVWNIDHLIDASLDFTSIACSMDLLVDEDMDDYAMWPRWG